MNNVFQQPDAIPVSLGSNCYVAMMIEEWGKADNVWYERQVFDWLGSSMWAICDLMDADFADLTRRTMIVPRQRYMYKPDKLLSHLRYNVVFQHEFTDNTPPTDEAWAKFEEKYARRIQRFRLLLDRSAKTGKKLFFVRLEKATHARIHYPEFDQEHDETFFLEYFAEQMRQRGVNFHILYLTTSAPTDYKNNIIYVHYTLNTAKYSTGLEQLRDVVYDNIQFIRECLKT